MLKMQRVYELALSETFQLYDQSSIQQAQEFDFS